MGRTVCRSRAGRGAQARVGVTASLAFIDAAMAGGADALLVHHGLFWRGQDGRLTGWLPQRVAPLMAHGINLFAYHLPLDAHPELGNNAQLGSAWAAGRRPIR
jgi:putative NIF3 family GTP cyclohydrolase 1 type 2